MAEGPEVMQDTLLVTIDSLRADHVGHLGYNRDTTPLIDQVAQEGMSFENAFANACSTRPSFPSILTSSYALMYGGYEQVSDEQTVISEVFDDAGYETAGFHSNLYLGADFNYDRGFDTFFDSKTNPSTMAQIRQFVKDHLDEDGIIYRTLANAFDTAERQAGANIGSAYVEADEITDKAINWIDTTDSDLPHFLWVHYMDVHHPYVPPVEHQRKFREDPISERQAIKLRRKMLQEPDAVTDSELSDIIDLYDAEIRFCDTEIGRLVSHVRDVWDGVNVMITADHGEEFREHGKFSHHATFYDEVIHVPLVFEDGQHQGDYEELACLLDVPPTLVDAAGLEIPNKFHGSILHNQVENDNIREAVFGNWAATNSDNERFMFRSHKWKYIRHEDDEELYDLETDPDETENVLNQQDDVVAHIRDAVDAHRQEVVRTDTDMGHVEMDEDVKERLRKLGYKE